MTATVTQLRPRSGPCGSGTIPGQVSPPCGKSGRLHAAGWRCEDHPPPSTADLRVPLPGFGGEAA